MYLSMLLMICQLSGIHGELEISVLSDSYCLLQVHNETDTEGSVIVNENEMEKPSPLTVYGNKSRSCDLQINGSPASQRAQIEISVVAGNTTGLDYLYVERIGPINVCSDRFVAFMGPLEPCAVHFANDIVQLHFRGDIVLGIHDVTIGKDHLLGCPKDGNFEDRVGALEGQTSNCKQVKVFNSVIHCVSIMNHKWWNADVFRLDQALLKPEPTTRCDLQCPDNCSCSLSDRQVIYNCPKNVRHLDQNSSFVLFSTDISRLDLSRNYITALMTNTFSNIGKHIIYLDLTSNYLSSLKIGIFTNMKSLVYLHLGNNVLTNLDPGIFDNLHSMVLVHLSQNSLTTLSARLFTNQPRLLSINLFGNKLTTLDKDAFANLHNVHGLLLSKNALITLSSEIFHPLYNVRILYLHSNQIKHFGDDTFSNLSKLTHLSLAHNHLSFLSFNLFGDLLGLVHLDLSANRLQDIPRLGHMTFLIHVDLLGNPLTKITQDMFSGVPSTASVLVDKPEICFCYLNESNTCFYTSKPSPYLTCNRLLSLPVLNALNWIVGCGAFLGNAFVLWWKQYKHKASKKPQSILLSNLAMSDLLMGIYMIIIASADVFYGEYFPTNAESWRSGITCKLAGTLAMTSSEASVLFVTLISIDRFINIKFPLSLHKLNVISTKVISFFVWTFALILGLMASVSAGKNPDFYDNSHVCIGLPLAQVLLTETNTTGIANINWWENEISVQVVKSTQENPGLYFAVAIFIAFNMFCFLLILACYIGIIRTVSKTSKAASRQREMAEEIRMTIKVSVIVLTDFSCWFPICLIGVLVQIGLVELPNSVFAWVITLILPINSAINPFLYTLFTLISEKCSKGPQESAIVVQPIKKQSLSGRVQDATDTTSI